MKLRAIDRIVGCIRGVHSTRVKVDRVRQGAVVGILSVPRNPTARDPFRFIDRLIGPRSRHNKVCTFAGPKQVESGHVKLKAGPSLQKQHGIFIGNSHDASQPLFRTPMDGIKER